MQTSNVVLITVDSLRYDRLGPKYEGDLAPSISSIASEGVRFTQAVANGPNTRTSFPSILTGTYPLMYGGYSYLSGDRPFVAQEFRRAGYETVGYHSNPHLGRDQNYDTGFERFNDEAEGSDSLATLKDGLERRLDPDSSLYSLLRRIWHRFIMSTGSSSYARADTISDNAVDWLESYDGGEPFFMWLHYMDVHYPFMPPDRCLDELGIDPLSDQRVAELNGKMHERPGELGDDDLRDLWDLYRGEIRYVDSEIGRVVEQLESAGFEDTTVVVTADHGEGFGEHGEFGHGPHLYDELLRVPLVIDGPELEPRRIDEQVPLLDLGPTLLALSGIDVPPTMQGESVFADTDDEPVLSAASSGDVLSCRTEEWKCIWQVSSDDVELYDLTTDPEETTDVSEEHADVVDDFRDEMESHLDAARRTDSDIPEVDRSDAAERRLRDLGYVE